MREQLGVERFVNVTRVWNNAPLAIASAIGDSMIQTFREQLIDIEQLFFSWLARVVISAALVGCAWIDDAPPLDIAAHLIAGYVALRVVFEFKAFMGALPIDLRVLKVGGALFAQLLLGLSFLAVASFTERLAMLVVG